MVADRLEVMLIAWTPQGGTQVLGRLEDPDLIADVRDRLISRMDSSEGMPELRLVTVRDDDAE